MLKLPQSKGLDQRVSETQAWSCVLVLVKVEGGAGGTGGLPKQNYYFSNSKNKTSNHNSLQMRERAEANNTFIKFPVSLSSHCVVCMNVS